MRKAVVICLVVLGVVTSTRASAYAANRNEVGIATSASFIWMSQQALNSRLNDIAQLGATWVRIDFEWPIIQPKSEYKYNWRAYDRVVAAAAAHHLKILATVDYTPGWARDPYCNARVQNEYDAQRCAPRSSQEFAHFAGAIAHHYQGKNIRGWEIWNEPNMLAFWKTVRPNGQLAADPVQYARIANAAASQIRGFASDADIITGGLAPLFEPNPSVGMRQSDFLRELLPHLQANLFDGVGLHPYSWPALPQKPAIYNAFYTTDHGGSEYDLLSIMHRSGWQAKQIWATEYGASTVGTSTVVRPTLTARPDHVSEDTQSQMIHQGIIAWSAQPFAGPIFIFSDSDQWLAARRNLGGFGLRRADGAKKPAYYAFQQAVAALP